MATITDLKQALDMATEAYELKKAELVAAGLNSKQRYDALKELKAVQDTANTAYVRAANAAVKKQLDKIIRDGAKVRRQIKADKKALGL